MRAAFFVDWDPQSLYSLQNNIKEITVVIPDWLTIDPQTYRLVSKIDPTIVTLAKANKVQIFPLLSNIIDGDFNSKLLSTTLSDPIKRKLLISDIYNLLEREGFEGINIDFENFTAADSTKIVQFQKELYTELRKGKFMVTQDIIPEDSSYDVQSLAK